MHAANRIRNNFSASCSAVDSESTEVMTRMTWSDSVIENHLSKFVRKSVNTRLAVPWFTEPVLLFG